MQYDVPCYKCSPIVLLIRWPWPLVHRLALLDWCLYASVGPWFSPWFFDLRACTLSLALGSPIASPTYVGACTPALALRFSH